MPKTAYLWDAVSLEHDTGPHVETIARAKCLDPAHLRNRLTNTDFPAVDSHDALESILRCHTRYYHDHVRSLCEDGGGLLDAGDTVASRGSYNASIGAVNAALTAVDLVMTGRARAAFSAMRPPGHHALPDRAMGFCLFANIAIAVRYMQAAYGVERVAIVDFDVHHGNGTQAMFYEDADVFFVSMHQYPLWPMSGLAHERGEGLGEGTTLNVTVAPNAPEALQLRMFAERVLPAVEGFRPEALFISAGFDAHRDDPIAQLNLTETGFATMTTQLRQLADAHSEGRIVSLLEGGYNLDALANSVVAHVNALSADSAE